MAIFFCLCYIWIKTHNCYKQGIPDYIEPINIWLTMEASIYADISCPLNLNVLSCNAIGDDLKLVIT